MRSRWLWWGGLLVICVGALVAWPYVRPAFSGGVLATADWLRRTGPWGPLLVIVLETVASVVSPLPSWPVVVAAGALYGAIPGTFYALVGAMAGAAANFVLARRLGRPLVERKLGPKWVGRVDSLGPMSFLLLSLFARLIPVASFDVVAYLAGIARIQLLTFMGVSLVGQAPGLFAYAWFGYDLAAAEQAGLVGSLLMLLFLGLVLVGKRLWERFTS